ncbi:MAG TPA: M13 family metallopeptidase [Verrucomicrobiae bacterium]|nr:M13 family metallopeptidase [Verrucomicrobiae bacterium]
MKTSHFTKLMTVTTAALMLAGQFPIHAQEAAPKVPRFSVDYMDRSVDPAVDFYHFADGNWLKNNPVPEDKSRWMSFDEVRERNWKLIHGLLDAAAADTAAPAKSPRGEVGAFFASAMDTNRINELGFKPLEKDFARIAALKSTDELMQLLAEFHLRDVGGMFGVYSSPDSKDSSVYALHFSQGGLSLPDRDYYLSDGFAKQREAYTNHIAKMFELTGEKEADAQSDAATVLELETALAKASKSRTDLRDPIANYHKFTVAEIESNYPDLEIKTYLSTDGLDHVQKAIVGQPEFLAALDKLVKERPLSDWKTYLRWHVLHSAAPLLQTEVEKENFAFFGTVLSGQPQQEPRWQRAARVIDRSIGEALGQLFVEKYFPPEARARMNELIGNLKAVLHDRLERLTWMTEPTKAKALAKFNALTQKIGYPQKFRDYSKVQIVRDDYLGNVQRAAIFESKRELARIGKKVDKKEWEMTPQTVNAYFNPLQNEIVFPAGILQPPFFDVTMDDAVNYGGIGVVIGHEMTHSYDDQGRKYDAHGNLHDWWTEADAKAFEERAQKVVDQYSNYKPLPGVHVNGRLTLGENIADLGGVNIAYEALERDLEKHPEKRKKIDGFTPEQRFFISFAQVWRANWREPELRRDLIVDPHSPGQFRAVGPSENVQAFYDAFNIKPGEPMYRPPDQRAIIW